MTRQRLCLSFMCLLLLAVLAGCGGTTVSGALPPAPIVPPATPTPTPGSPTPTPTPVVLTPSRFVFGIIDFEADGFFGGTIDSSTGKVSPAPGNPTANPLGQNIVIQLLADPKGRFLYSLNLGASSFGIQFGQVGIAAFQINRTSGALVPAPGQITFPAQRLGLLAIDGTAHFLYQPDGSSVDIYSIDQTNGRLTIMPSTVPMAAVGLFSAASADGRFLFNAGSGVVEAYAINPANGQLSVAATPVPTGGSAGPMAVSADSRFLYVANQVQGTVAVYAIGANGSLTTAPGSPFATDPQAAGMSLSPDGRFLYMTFQVVGESHVKGFAVNPAAGTFTPIAGASIANADSINVDGSGKFAYVSQSQLVTFKVDPTTGALTPVSQAPQPFSSVPLNMVLTP